MPGSARSRRGTANGRPPAAELIGVLGLDARGLEVSLGSLSQDQFVKRQIAAGYLKLKYRFT
jgi:hypothetical protein